MSPDELAEFNRALRTDADMRRVLKLETALRENIHQTEKARFSAWTQQAKRKAARQKWLTVAAAFLALALLAWLLLLRPQHPFEQQEGLERLEQIIAQDSLGLQVVADAGGQDWRNLLLDGTSDDTKLWQQARRILQAELLQASVPCAPRLAVLHYYHGVLALYLDRDYAQSLRDLTCAYQHELRYRQRMAIPLALSHIGTGDVPAAEKILAENQIPTTALPQKAQELLR